MKNWNKQQWLILLLLGLILLVAAIPTKNQLSQEVSESGDVRQEEAGGISPSSSSGSSYATSQAFPEKAALEQQLEDLLRQVEGIGNVRAMLMLEGSSDSIAAFSGENTTSSISGVLIVAEGGDNPVVVRDIQEAVMALFQIEAHKIKVMKMK